MRNAVQLYAECRSYFPSELFPFQLHYLMLLIMPYTCTAWSVVICSIQMLSSMRWLSVFRDWRIILKQHSVGIGVKSREQHKNLIIISNKSKLEIWIRINEANFLQSNLLQSFAQFRSTDFFLYGLAVDSTLLRCRKQPKMFNLFIWQVILAEPWCVAAKQQNTSWQHILCGKWSFVGTVLQSSCCL